MSIPTSAVALEIEFDAETRRTLRNFLRNAVSRLSATLKDRPPDWGMESRWERADDRHFREREKRTRILWNTLKDEWLRSLDGYEECIEQLKSDALIGPHLDRLVGTSWSSSRFDTGRVLNSAIYAVLEDQENLAFSDERFEREWLDLVEFCGAKQFAFTTVAPLSGLVVPDLPLRLGKDVVIDRLTDDEVTRCWQAGLFRPMPPQWHSTVIYDKQAVGFRWTTSLPKLLLRADKSPHPPESADEGKFCDRPLPRLDLALDDVLSALRLLKPGVVSAAGAASWADSPWVRGTSFHLRGDSRHFGKYELSKEEARDLQQLWGLLEKLEKGSPLSFSIHRFNLAFERGLPFDRIVDLVISAESLFLGDIQDRGELGFRLALRAAKFIVDPKYCEREIYKRMKEAYDARSAIVHGRRTTDSKLPDINKLEDLVRLGLRKALSFDDPKRLKEPQYWESLILSGSNPP